MWWQPEHLRTAPLFTPLRPLLARLPGPDLETLNRLAERLGVRSGGGAPLRFIAARPGLDYETHIYHNGEVPTRPDNLHDLFNALAWLCYPQAKAALNALHLQHLAAATPGRRGRARDRLTLIDESGALIACRDPRLAALLRGQRWRALFWRHRQRFRAGLHCQLFGHALFEKAVTPYLGLTAKAVIIDLNKDDLFFGAAPQTQTARLDAALAARLRQPGWLTDPARLPVLPVLGVPGWWPANDDPTFYNNERYFRPAPQQAATVLSLRHTAPPPTTP